MMSLDEELYSDNNGLIFLMLYSANLHDLTIVEMLSWSSNNIFGLFAVLVGVSVVNPS